MVFPMHWSERTARVFILETQIAQEQQLATYYVPT